MKGDTNDCFLFDSFFYSNNLVESVMDVGADMIGVVKTNTKVFFKETIDNITNNWPGYSYLVLRSKPMVPRVRPLIAIGYKHIWELPGNYPVFYVVMEIYHYVEITWRILVTPVCLYNIYDH